MDGITEKFSVFDFFNLIIGGIVFIFGLWVCTPSQIADFYTSTVNTANNSWFSIFLAVVAFLGIALVFGMVITEIAHWIFDTKFHLEKTLIETSLNKNQLIKNSTKLAKFRQKAQAYLNVNQRELDNDFTTDECSAYFAYCVYYLHVHGQDKKTEKLREAQSLSELLTIVFVLIPISSIALHILAGAACLVIKPTVLLYLMFAVFALIFLRRSKRAMENRIKMVLAVYDACVDMNSNRD